MRPYRRAMAAAIATAAAAATAEPPNGQDIAEDIVARVDPSVVAIQHERAAGSGFFVSEDGYVLTNGHVVRGDDEEDPTRPARSITVVLHDEQKFPARVIGFSMDPDVALLKIDPPAPVRPVAFADVRAAHVGQVCFAVGTPIGLKRTYTRGILSNIDRADLGTETRVFQTDAAINPGNSGGPLFDGEGRVLGLNTYTGRGNNLGFTIPIDVADVLRRHFLKHGRFVRAWVPLFTTGELYDELARSLKVDRGILVNYVMPDSPAYAAGLRDGDVIIQADGRPCSARRLVELLDFQWALSTREPGETVVFTVLRGPGGRRATATVTLRLEAMEPLPTMGRHAGELVELRYEALGLGVWPIVRLHRVIHSLPDDPGVLVATVRPSSPAARAGLRRLDILTRVDGQACADVPALVAALDAALAARRPAIELDVVRGWRRWPTALAPHYTLDGRAVVLVALDAGDAMAALVRRELAAEGAEVIEWRAGGGALPPADRSLNAILLVGGSPAALRKDAALADCLRKVWEGHGVVAAAGGAALAPLAAVRELKKKRMTTDRAYSAEAERLGGKYTGKDVEADGRWITAASTERSTMRAFVRAVQRAAWSLDSGGEPEKAEESPSPAATQESAP